MIINAVVTVVAAAILATAFAAGVFALFCRGLNVHLQRRRDENL
jgi:hypothetical protein